MSKKALEKMRVDLGRSAVEVRADTFNPDDRTVEVVWSTGAKVKRYDWNKDGWYIEELSMEPKAIRMDRFNAGMSLLDTHDGYSMNSRIGAVIPKSVRVEGGKGIAVVKLSRNQLGEQILTDLRDGMPIQISVGYKVHRYEKTTSEEGSIPTYRAIDWEPMELSAVPIPADAGAHSRAEEAETFEVTIETRGEDLSSPVDTETNFMNKRNAAKNFTGAQLEALALGAGLTRKADETEDQLRERLIAVYDAEDAATRAETEAQEREARAAEEAQRAAQQNADKPLTAAEIADISRKAIETDRKRASEIRELAKRAGFESDPMVIVAVDSGAAVESFRTALFEKIIEREEGYGTFPHVETRGMQDAQDTFRRQVANAVLHRNNLVKDLKLEDGARQYRDLPLLDVAREVLARNGQPIRGGSIDIVRRALHSTSDFPIILGDITRQILLQGYQGYANTFELISTLNTVPDLREVKVLEMGDAPDLDKITESGEYKRGTVKESQEGFTIGHYGKVIGLTEAMIINDQLSAFARLISGWGRKVSKLEGDIVWKIVLDNAKLKDGKGLFHADHKNLITAGTALDVTNLKAARLLFRKQTDIDGGRIDMEPRFLFTGTEYEVAAQQIVNGTTTPQTVDQIVPQVIKSLQPVYEHRIDTLSDKAWFLFADAASTMGRGLQHARLAGYESPRTMERVGFDYDGVEYRLDHYFGGGLTDYRFGVKNPGN